MIEISRLDQAALKRTIGYAVTENTELDDFGARIASAIGPDYASDGDLWGSAKKEFRKLLCDQSAEYSDIQEQAAKIAPDYTTGLVSVISAAMGAALGIGAAIIAPLVGLLLLTLAKVGKNSICATWPK